MTAHLWVLVNAPLLVRDHVQSLLERLSIRCCFCFFNFVPLKNCVNILCIFSHSLSRVCKTFSAHIFFCFRLKPSRSIFFLLFFVSFLFSVCVCAFSQIAAAAFFSSLSLLLALVVFFLVLSFHSDRNAFFIIIMFVLTASDSCTLT